MLAARYTNLKLEPYVYPEDARTVAVRIAPSRNLARGTILGELDGTDSRQSLTVGGAPTGGSFTLTWNGQTTAAIAWNAEPDAVQAAIEALSNVGPGNVRVTGGPFPAEPMTVEFIGALADAPQAAFTHTDSLTGGTSPAVTVASAQTGVVGNSGVYDAYSHVAVNGLQTPKLILAYDVQTDASGNINLSDTAGLVAGEFGETHLTVPAYAEGWFLCQELVGLDTYAVAGLGRLTQGGIASGVLHVGR